MKRPTTFQEQADKLLSRGLIADRDELLQRLNAVSYYRLSDYLYPFRQPRSDQYFEGTNLKVIALITPTSQWSVRVEDLFAEYADIPVQDIGLPYDWKAHPVWTQT